VEQKNRKPTSIYIDRELYRQFSDRCTENMDKVNLVVERLMKEYISGSAGKNTHTNMGVKTKKSQGHARQDAIPRVIKALRTLGDGRSYPERVLREIAGNAYASHDLLLSDRTWDAILKEMMTSKIIQRHPEYPSEFRITDRGRKQYEEKD